MGMGGGMGGMGGGMGGMGGLSQDDMEEMREAREAALQADPALAAEGKALQEKQRAYQKKVEAAMIKADPDVAPILAQLEAMRQQYQAGMGGGQPAPPHPASTPAPATKPTGQ
jgi:Spy/CpxP family protein refolding chaperone